MATCQQQSTQCTIQRYRYAYQATSTQILKYITQMSQHDRRQLKIEYKFDFIDPSTDKWQRVLKFFVTLYRDYTVIKRFLDDEYSKRKIDDNKSQIQELTDIINRYLGDYEAIIESCKNANDHAATIFIVNGSVTAYDMFGLYGAYDIRDYLLSNLTGDDRLKLFTNNVYGDGLFVECTYQQPMVHERALAHLTSESTWRSVAGHQLIGLIEILLEFHYRSIFDHPMFNKLWVRPYLMARYHDLYDRYIRSH